MGTFTVQKLPLTPLKLMIMKKRTIAFVFGFFISLFTASMIAQGQVYLYGQMVSNAASTRFTEAMQLKTTNPVSSINMTTKATSNLAKTTLYANSTKIIVSSISLQARSRTITAALTSGILPSETTLKLNVGEPSKNFKGYPGEISSTVVLSSANVTVIRDISTCTSGKSSEDGYGLEYSCEMPAKQNVYRSLQGKSLTVTFTVTADTNIL